MQLVRAARAATLLLALFLASLWPVVAGADEAPIPAMAVPSRIVLPPLVAVFEAGISNARIEPEWTAQAERIATANLAEAARAHGWVMTDGGWTDAEREQVYEFQRLVGTVASRATEFLTVRPAFRLARFDGNVGPSLSFVADRFGIDEAVGVVAIHVEQSGAAAAAGTLALASAVALAPWMPVLPAITGSNLLGYAVNLRTGQIHWYEFDHAPEFVGINTGDLRDPKSARRLYGALTDKLARSLKEAPPAASPRKVRDALSWEVPTDRPFRVHVPAQWHSTLDERSVTATRDGMSLNAFTVTLDPHMSAFRRTHRATSSRSTPAQLAEWFLAELFQRDLSELQIVDSSIDATLVGQPAARVRFTYRPWAAAPVRENVVLLTATHLGMLSATLTAPRLTYFERALPDFEAMAGSVTPGIGM